MAPQSVQAMPPMYQRHRSGVVLHGLCRIPMPQPAPSAPVQMAASIPVMPAGIPVAQMPAVKSALPATSGDWVASSELQTCSEVELIGGSSPT